MTHPESRYPHLLHPHLLQALWSVDPGCYLQARSMTTPTPPPPHSARTSAHSISPPLPSPPSSLSPLSRLSSQVKLAEGTPLIACFGEVYHQPFARWGTRQKLTDHAEAPYYMRLPHCGRPTERALVLREGALLLLLSGAGSILQQALREETLEWREDVSARCVSAPDTARSPPRAVQSRRPAGPRAR